MRDTRLIRVNDRVCSLSLVFEFLKTAFDCRHLSFESGVFQWGACSFGRLVSEALARAIQQALLRERAGLQARDGGIDSHIFRVAASIKGERDEANNGQHKNNGYRAEEKRPSFLVDGCYHLLIRVLALFGKMDPLPKLVCNLFAPQL
jgi:hypothetical protein